MTNVSELIAPHGGTLINRIASPDQKAEFLAQADSLPRLTLDARATSDLEMIAIGGFSPLSGFMEKTDYLSVVESMHLSNGAPWSVPVTLSVTEKEAASLTEGNLVRLDDPFGNFVGVLELTEKYDYDKKSEAVNVYRTDEEAHPGVKVIYEQGAINLAGPVWLLERQPHPLFPKYQIDPAASRQLFQ
ncbi:MAG: sulfate adenylyltransferase, partial [Merismopedia sp. SIO2A8]|nr:sulfate adenylyltransferase [Merismopedia sp. SIO2A8]